MKEKYLIARKKAKELMNQIRQNFMYKGIDVAFCIQEELAWNLIKIVDEIDNGQIPKFTFKEYLIQLEVYYSKFFRALGRREFISTKNKYKKKDYLFFAMDNSHYSRLKEIIKQFPKDKTLLLVTHIKTQRKVEEDGYDFVSFGDYFARPLKKFKIDISNIEWKYKGIDLIKQLRRMIKYLEKRAEWIAYYIECLEKIYRELGIQKIIMIDCVIPINRVAILVAKNIGIESWIVKREIVSKKSGRYYLPMIADKICIWSNFDRDFLINKGVDANKIHIVGVEVVGEVNGFEVPVGRKFILFISHFYDDLYSLEVAEKTAIMKKLIDIADKTNYQIIIKLHPREHNNLYGNHPKITVLNDFPLEPLIKTAEFVLVSTSTSSLKVIAMGKPLLVLNYIDLFMPIDYEKYNIKVLKYRDNLLEAIKNYNSRKEKRKELIEYYCNPKKSTCKKIKNLICKNNFHK
jgi:hypothetical protein